MKERFEEQLTQLNETAKLLATLTDALQFAEDNYTDIFYNAELHV